MSKEMDRLVFAVAGSVVRLVVLVVVVGAAFEAVARYAASSDDAAAVVLSVGAGVVTFTLLMGGILAVARRSEG